VNAGGKLRNLGKKSKIQSDITLAGNATFTGSGNEQEPQDYLGILSGVGGITIEGSGPIIFSAANTYSGDTAITSGTLRLTNESALQNSTLTTGRVEFDSSVAGRSFTLGGLSGSGNLTLSNTDDNSITLLVGNNVTGAGTTTYGGSLGGAGGAMAKIGTGRLTLSGVNTYTGATTVSFGTLATGNDSALGGTASVVVARGATLQIGENGVNTITLASGATLAVSGTLKFNARTSAGTSAITLAGIGGYTLADGAILDLSSFFDTVGRYNLIGGGTGPKTDGVPTFTGIDRTRFSAEFAQGVLTVSAVPEPVTYGLLGAGAFLSAALVRRRRRTQRQ
jgi:autotransporter-associated beta strand protein